MLLTDNRCKWFGFLAICNYHSVENSFRNSTHCIIVSFIGVRLIVLLVKVL